ncbi:MAG: preprotein translocase subunit YajC [Firmicutes bacterium HGW-Firmicutes-12]|nr:MAG: preprotein translocase subunit YajC [Firmicutes bacterium HGW-Firmicutes-12]
MQNSLMWLVLLIALMYFMMIRPQQKQKKQRQELLGSLNKGDNIVTIGGIHGKIIALTDDSVVLEISPEVKITMQRTAVGIVQTEEVEEEDDDEVKQLDENTEDEGKL